MVFGDVLTSLTTQFVRLFEENRRVIEMLQGAGFELPPAVQQIAEFSLSRLFEDEVKAHLSTDDPEAYRRAIEIARDVMAHGYRIDKSETAVAFQARIEEKVREATSDPSEENIQSAVSLLELSHDLRLDLQLERAQESVYVALSKNGAKAAELKRLAIAVGLSPDIKVGPEENIARDGKPADHPAADAAANWP